jgi:hypothetical protein
LSNASASPLSFSIEQAAHFTDLALRGITREYPNHPGHLLNNSGDVKNPRALHPAFYGCYDWHSAVHSHWMLVRLLKCFPAFPQAQVVRAALGENLNVANLRAEADYFLQPNRQSFERTYGWTWLLKLAEELHTWRDPDGAHWAGALKPLEEIIIQGYLDYLPRLIYPIRVGTHPNTAFGLTFALDYARNCERPDLELLIVKRSCDYYSQDVDYPAGWEPGGSDFLSPALCEADLMARVLPADEFTAWFERFLPGIGQGEPRVLLTPALVSDRSDPQLVHLDGLNLSRAWCMRRIASALPAQHPAGMVLAKSVEHHAAAGLAQVTSGHYVGEHWLASFAVYLLLS